MALSLRSIILASTLLLIPGILPAQTDSMELTGILPVDLRMGLREEEMNAMHPLFASPLEEQGGRKSVVLAGGLSAILPGAGQLYAEAPLWRTLLYGAIEVAGWTAYGIYTGKGNQATTDFESYADRHWDVTRYVGWIADNYQRWGAEDVDKQAAAEALAAIYLSNDSNLPPWQRIDFEQLNKLERAVNGGFSHTLARYGAQSYYEEIGKYIQYRAGWDDHAIEGDTMIFDPSRVSSRNRDYVGQREDANALLGYATTALGVVVLNHVVSMIDASLEARSYNISLHSDFRGETLPNGRRVLTADVGVMVRF